MGTNEIINHLKKTKYITSTKDNKTIADEAEIEGSNPVDAGSGENSVMIDAYGNAADGEASVALGMSVQAENDAESAFGQYNKSNTGTIHSVGVGVDDEHRENAFEILDDGSVYVKGIGGYTGANPLPGTNDLQTIVGGVKQFTYVFADSLPTASADTMYIIYFIPAPTPAQQNNKDEYITVDNGEEVEPRYAWEQIGSATVDLSAYSTTAEMNAAIAAAVPWEAASGTGSVIVKESGNVADNNHEVSVGTYNKSNSGTQFSVGIGSGTNNRKNAFEVKSDGSVYVKGVGGYDGTNPTTDTNDLKTVLASKPSTSDIPWEKGTGSNSAVMKGSQGTVTGSGAVSEGSATNASGSYSHTEGRQTTTTATGEYAHAEGYLSEAQEAYSHAEGFTSVAGGQMSHAEGAYAQTTHAYEHAEGIYNKSNTKTDGTAEQNKAGTTQLSVGIGASNAARANALEVMQNGDVYVKGIGGYDGTNPNTSGVSSLQGSFTGKVNGDGVGNIVKMTKAQYDSLVTKDPSTIYLVDCSPASFAGLEICPAPLYYGANGFEIKDSDWNHNSYQQYYGKVEGSYLFDFIELGSYFDSDGNSFNDQSGSIDNANTIDGWRVPTSSEFESVLTTNVNVRQGSTVNGVSGKHYSMITYGSDKKGLLIYPDGFNYELSALTNFDSTTINTLTVDQINALVAAGCAFLPKMGRYSTGNSWYNWGVYWYATEFGNASRAYCLYFESSMNVRDAENKTGYYDSVRLVRTIQASQQVQKLYLGSVLIADSSLPSEIASILATI